ncbi:MAG: ISL3 family transposase [Nanoarchaeota archaeon]|nr:ISL3 family transposase [Nanoarchaeota archaeon]
MIPLHSVLRNLFPFKGYKVFVFENEKSIFLELKSCRKCGICPCCNKRTSNVEAEYERTVRDLDLGERQCYLTFSQKKIRCICGYRGLEKLDFVEKSRRVTKRMETYIVSLCEKMSLKEVTEIVNLNWKTVKSIDHEYIKSLLPKISELDIRRIAIDEIAIMKGHKYLTIIRDYDTGIAIKITLGRNYEAISRALASLGSDILKGIEYASLDLWDPYIKAIKEQCPNVKLIFDKFHVVKKVNKALDKVRKQEFAKAEPEERKRMKHKRFVILKRKSNLNQKQKGELQELMNSNEKLYKSYLLKEQILSIFDEKKDSFEKIKKRISSWFENILSNQMEEFYPVVTMMNRHLKGILNYFRYGMTNAISEGFNTKINVIKRHAFGFRDVEYFMLKIYQNSTKRFA